LLKSKPLLLALFVLSSIALLSCGNGSEENNSADTQPSTDTVNENTAPNETTVNPPSLRLSEGQSFRVRMEVLEDQSDSISPAGFGSLRVEKVIGFEVVDSDRSGNWQLRGTYEELTALGEVAGAEPEENEILQPIVGQSFELWVSPDGEVQDLTGFDEMFEAFVEALRENEEFSYLFEFEVPEDVAQEYGVEGSSMAAITLQPLFEIFVGEKATETTLKILFASYPDSSAAGAETSWSDSDVVAQSTGIPFPSDNTWTLSGSTENQIEADVSFQFDPAPEVIAMDLGFGGSIYYTEIEGSGSGNYLLDLETGWPERVELNFDFTMKTDIRGIDQSDQEPSSMTGSVQIMMETLR